MNWWKLFQGGLNYTILFILKSAIGWFALFLSNKICTSFLRRKADSEEVQTSDQNNEFTPLVKYKSFVDVKMTCL